MGEFNDFISGIKALRGEVDANIPLMCIDTFMLYAVAMDSQSFDS